MTHCIEEFVRGPRVYLLYQNDSVIGVFAKPSAAIAEARKVREEIGGEWRARGWLWWQPDGRFARLEIEEREVRT